MKKFILILLSFSFFLHPACNKKSTATSDEYYVKYVIDGRSSIQQNSPTGLKIILINETKAAVEYTRSSRGVNEFTIGPVQKGFNASLTGTNMCPVVNSCPTLMDLQIFVSKNSGPFVLKREDVNSATYRSSVQITHEIDF